MFKDEIWKDRSGNHWEILAAETKGPFPVMARCLNPDVKGNHMFTAGGQFSSVGDVSVFDLVEVVSGVCVQNGRQRDEIFDLTRSALTGILASKSALPVELLAEFAVSVALAAHKELGARVR